MQRHNAFLAASFSTVLAVVAPVASATMTAVTVSGTILPSGRDTTGYFFPTATSLGGLPFSLTFLIDDTKGVISTDPGVGVTIVNSVGAASPSPISAIFTLNSVSLNLDCSATGASGNPTQASVFYLNANTSNPIQATYYKSCSFASVTSGTQLPPGSAIDFHVPYSVAGTGVGTFTYAGANGTSTLAQWNNARTSVSAVPEPRSAMLLLLCGSALLAYRNLAGRARRRSHDQQQRGLRSVTQ